MPNNVCDFKIGLDVPMSTGQRMIGGTFLMSNTYHTGGDILNLTNYINGTSTPVLLLGGGGGYSLQSDKGQASTIKIKCYYSEVNATTANGIAANIPLAEVLATVNLSATNISFICIGQRADNV